MVHERIILKDWGGGCRFGKVGGLQARRLVSNDMTGKSEKIRVMYGVSTSNIQAAEWARQTWRTPVFLFFGFQVHAMQQ